MGRLSVGLLVLSLASSIGCGQKKKKSPTEPAPLVTRVDETANLDEAKETPEPNETPEPKVVRLTPEPSQQDEAMLGGTPTHAELVKILRDGSARQYKPVGTSSAVFRLKLRGQDEMVALKPSSRAHSNGWRAEIAAYKVARSLNLPNVPPATYRKVTREQLGHFLHREFDEYWIDIRRSVRWTGASADAAAIYWLPSMRRIPIDRAPKPYRVWLSQNGSVPKGKESLAKDSSNMILFDYLIGNWDRFSGGNIHGTPDGTRLYFRDHNVAFSSLTPTLHRRIHQRLVKTQRVSRTFVEAIRALNNAAAISGLLEEESQRAKTPILSDKQIEDILTRRESLLSHVSALVDQYGEDATFAFE